jgi:hypothetical protein
MPVYPVTSPAWSCPATTTLEFQTGVYTGTNGTEQRTMITAGRQSWGLTYPHASLAERDTLFTIFETAQGSFSQTLSLVWATVNYAGLFFDQDILQFTESADKPNRFSGSVVLKQVVRTPDTGSFPSDFPTLTSGARTQLPYTRGSGFRTVSVLTEGGRVAYATRASTLRTWTVGGTVLSNAEAQAIWDMFRLAGGKYRSFGMTDPDPVGSGTRYANCRFGSDTLTWTIISPGVNSITTSIQQCL